MFDIPSFTVDGMDLCAVQAASLHTVRGRGWTRHFSCATPTASAAITSATSRNTKDVGEAFTWRAKDPIVQLRI
jgi:TPP-dependent pyruvate/acetoin dehydrogenase alpha subunit